MADSCNQEHEMNGDGSSSDEDSLSLLRNLCALESREEAGDMGTSPLHSQVGDTQQTEINPPVKPPEPPVISSRTQCAEEEGFSLALNGPLGAANVLQSVKMPVNLRLNVRDQKGETLLHRACRRGDVSRVRFLLQAGVSVNTEDNAGWTALHEAATAGDEAVVVELVKAGANVNAKSFDGVTPLHDAVSSEHYQVVKLLLQNGANTSDRNFGGVSALEMAKEEDMKRLLSTIPAPSVLHVQPPEAPAQHTQPGEPSCQAQSASRPSDTAQADLQLRQTDTTTDHVSHSKAVTALLEKVQRKQTDISTWPLESLVDAGRYHISLTHVQNMLIEALDKQHWEKDHLTQKYRRASFCVRQILLQSGLVPLASRQSYMVELLQRQVNLVEAYVTKKAKLCTQPPNNQLSSFSTQPPNHLVTQPPNNLVPQPPNHLVTQPPNNLVPQPPNHLVTQPPNHLVTQPPNNLVTQPPNNLVTQPPNNLVTSFSTQPPNHLVTQPPNHLVSFVMRQLPILLPAPASTLASSKARPTHSFDNPTIESYRPVRQASVFRGELPNNAMDIRVLTPLEKKAGSQMKRTDALIQTIAEDDSRHLSKLLQGGVMPTGSALQMSLKGHLHLAHVLSNGYIQDSTGRVHMAPEGWLEAVLGNNIPVSVAYAWDKVMFRDKPLSYHALKLEADRATAQSPTEDRDEDCWAVVSQEELTTGAASMKRLMKIKIIHLVENEELLPNALMDCYWEKLLQAEDWEETF